MDAGYIVLNGFAFVCNFSGFAFDVLIDLVSNELFYTSPRVTVISRADREKSHHFCCSLTK